MRDHYLLISMAIDYMAIELLMKNPSDTISVEITPRTLELIYSIRDMWFPDEEIPMTAGEAINVICCAIYYNKITRKK